MIFENKIKEIEKEIEELKVEEKELIEEYDLKKPYHAIDIFEMLNVKESNLKILKKLQKQVNDKIDDYNFVIKIQDYVALEGKYDKTLTDLDVEMKKELKKSLGINHISRNEEKELSKSQEVRK